MIVKNMQSSDTQYNFSHRPKTDHAASLWALNMEPTDFLELACSTDFAKLANFAELTKLLEKF